MHSRLPRAITLDCGNQSEQMTPRLKDLIIAFVAMPFALF
jgi:hypothetical protein